MYLVRAALRWMHLLPSHKKTMPTTTKMTKTIRSANRGNGCKRPQLNEPALSAFLSTAAVFSLLPRLAAEMTILPIAALNAFSFGSGVSVRVSVIRPSFSMPLSRVDQSKGIRGRETASITQAHKWKLHWPVRWWFIGTDRLLLLLLHKMPCRNNDQSEES